MRTPARWLLASAASVLAATLVAVPAASDPPPTATPYSGYWPRCGEAPDDDGRYCIESVTRNGVSVPSTTSGEAPYVDLIGDGTVRYGVTAPGGGGSVDPGATWRFVVNTGSIRPRMQEGVVRDVDFTIGGGPGSWRFTLQFRPAPIAWMWPPDGDGDGYADCSYHGGCGDDSTVAGLVYDGFVTGYVTDLLDSGLSAAERADRTGMISSSNAQDFYTLYDPDANALLVRMANPHLRSPGVPATGYFDAFLPNDLLVNEMAVPSPASLTGGSFTVSRTGGAGSVPFTLAHEPGGIRIHIADIGFSRPQYRIKPKPTAPGKPRKVKVVRTGTRSLKVTFKRPVADGGKRVRAYVVRCRKGHGPWLTRSGTASPIRFASVPVATVTCQVRAENAKGAGKWSPRASG
jgi:hypothetical protein